MPSGEALGGINREVNDIVKHLSLPENTRVDVLGSVVGMQESFKRFSIGLALAIVLVYLILMAQFASFVDPLIILVAIPPGLAGVVLILWLTHSTFNIMSLMGVIMMTGIVVSNSILIVEFARQLQKEDFSLQEALVRACKIRLRPILMTSLATLLGMLPMALGLETGSEQYAPLARAVIGGLAVSVVVTVFLVAPPPADVGPLIADAFAKRPEILALEFQSESAEKLHRAEHDQLYPTISALGAFGDSPVRDDQAYGPYAAAGVNIQIPVFNGFLYSAKSHEADLRAQGTRQRLIDLRNRIARDVRISWLSASTAFDRVSVSEQLLAQANQALRHFTH
jgi:predicted RND superfamily exporter protein